MRNVKLTLLAVIAILSLVLTGCYKITNVATVSYDGKLSGSFTVTVPIENADVYEGAGAIFASRSAEGPVDVLDITYSDGQDPFDEINKCLVTGMQVEIAETAYTDSVYFVVVYQSPQLDTKLYAVGYSSSVTATANGKLLFADVFIIPESGNVSDCEDFQDATSGDVYLTPNSFGSSLSLGSIQALPISEADVGTFPLQMKHLPNKDRLLYQTITTMFIKGSYNLNNPAADIFPETNQCFRYLTSAKFNALNTRTFKAGEFVEMLNDSKRIKVVSNAQEIRITCNYSALDLNYADRWVNEYPWQSESFNPMGFWFKADESLIWEYRFREQNRMILQSIRDEGVYTVNDLNKNENLNAYKTKMYKYLKKLGISQTVKINGVVLESSVDLDSENNSAVMSAPGVLSYGMDWWLVEGSVKPGADYLSAVIGQAVSFDAKKKTFASTNSELVKFAKQLKADSPDQIRLVGIYDGSISNESLAAKNEELVEQRLTVLKKKLKALGVKANFINGFVVDESSNSGDPKAKNKVVIQIVPVK
jgi:hypothetical protein